MRSYQTNAETRKRQNFRVEGLWKPEDNPNPIRPPAMRLHRLALALLATSILACGSDSTSPTQATIAGTWALQSINGATLPFVLAQTGNNKVEVLSDIATADSHGSWTAISQVRTTVNGSATTQSVSDAGTYTLNGTALSLRSNDGTVRTGTLSGNTFTLAESGFSYVYKKQ